MQRRVGDSMADNVMALVLKIMAAVDPSMQASLGTAEASAKQSFGNMAMHAGMVTAAVAAIITPIVLLGRSIADAAIQFEQYQIRLLTVVKSQKEANRLAEEAAEFAAKTPFDIEQVVQATVLIKALGTELVLTRDLASKLAITFNTDMSLAARALSRAMTGSSLGFRILRNQFGITTPELKKFGAVVRSNNSLVLKSAEAVEANKQALISLIETKYGDAIELQANTVRTAVVNVKDELMRLRVLLGNELLPSIFATAKAVKGFVASLKGTPRWLKQVSIGAFTLVGALAAMGGALTVSIWSWQIFSFTLKTMVVPWLKKVVVELLATKMSIGLVSGAVIISTYLLYQMADAYIKLTKTQIEAAKAEAIGLPAAIKLMKLRFDNLKLFKAGVELNKEELRLALAATKIRITRAQEALKAEQDRDKYRAGQFRQIANAMSIETKRHKEYMQHLKYEKDDSARTTEIAKHEARMQHLLKEKRAITLRRHELEKTLAVYTKIATQIRKLLAPPGKKIEEEKSAVDLTLVQALIKQLEDRQTFTKLTVKEEEKLLKLYKEEGKLIERKIVAASLFVGGSPKTKEEQKELDDWNKASLKNKQKQSKLIIKMEKDKFKAFEDRIHKEKSLGLLSLKEELDRYKQGLIVGKFNAEERKKIEHTVALIKKQIRDKDSQDAKDAAQVELQLDAERINTALLYVDRKKQLGEMSLQDEIKHLETILQTDIKNTKTREDLVHRLSLVKKQVTKDEVSQKKKTDDLSRNLTDKINQLTMTALDYKLWALQQEANAMVKRGDDEVEVRRWVEATKLKIIKDAIAKKKGLEAEEKSSPIMTLEEAMAGTSAIHKRTPKIEGLSDTETKAKVENTVIHIGSIEVKGPEAVALGRSISKLAGVDKSETIDPGLGIGEARGSGWGAGI